MTEERPDQENQVFIHHILGVSNSGGMRIYWATCTHDVQLLPHNVTSTPLHLSDRYKYSDLDFKYKTESFFSLNDPKMDRK